MLRRGCGQNVIGRIQPERHDVAINAQYVIFLTEATKFVHIISLMASF